MHPFFRNILIISGFWFISVCSNAQLNIIVFPEDNNISNYTVPAGWYHAKDISDAIETAKASTSSDITIYFYEGIHYLEQPITIYSHDFKGKSIRLAASPGKKAVLSGARIVPVNWQYAEGEKYLKAKIDNNSAIDQLFINKERRIMARYPNFSEGDKINTITEDALSSSRVSSWKDPRGGYIHALHSHGWGSLHYVIKDIVQNNLIYEGGFQNNRPSEIHEQYRYVENIFEELDAPGEWFFDQNKQIIYYYPLEDEDVSEIRSFEITQLPSLIRLIGSLNEPVRNVTIENLSFVQTKRTFMEEYEQLMRSDWCVHRNGAIFMEYVEDSSVRECELSQLGGNAIFLSKYIYNCSVAGNYIHNIGASAICVVGDTSSVRSPSYSYEQYVPFDKLDKTPGPGNELYPRQCMIENNLIHHIGETEKQVAGVQLQLAAQINVRHNTIYNVPRAAINVGDGAFGGHVIEYNDAFDTVLETSDHGAFNSWGRDRFWHPVYQTMDTLTSKHPELILLDARYTTIIRNNRFHCSHGWDIDLDDGSSNYHIYQNLCLQGGIKLREGFYRKVENNIMINNTLHPHVWFKNSGDIIQRNIVMTAFADIALQGWGECIDYNFFTDRQALLTARENSTDKHSLTGRLEFKDAINGNFTLVSDSPAFQIGFENFPMNRFGVYSPYLKSLALSPPIPVLELTSENNSLKEKFTGWMGAILRDVEGLGDRSRFGLPDEKGVIIVNLDNHSILQHAGIRVNDVIRSINSKPVNSGTNIHSLTRQFKKGQPLDIILYRNQEKIKIRVDK